MKKSVRANTTVEYHGRSGTPKLHWTEDAKPYVMVRAKGGGTKRLYLESQKAGKEIKGITALRAEASRRRR